MVDAPHTPRKGEDDGAHAAGRTAPGDDLRDRGGEVARHPRRAGARGADDAPRAPRPRRRGGRGGRGRHLGRPLREGGSGRRRSDRTSWGGQVTEHGGELIDQGHTALRQLVQELGFNLDNLLQAEQNGTEDFYWFDGAPYTYAQATSDLNGIYQKMHKDVSAASYPTLWNSYTQRGYELDHMSIVDWLNETCPNGGADM